MTIISDLPLNQHDLTELAATLKTRLGTGGTVKEGRIEIQGDHRDRIVQELEGMGYRVRRAGGLRYEHHPIWPLSSQQRTEDWTAGCQGWLLALLAVSLQFFGLDIRFCITMLFGIGHLAERKQPGEETIGVAKTDGPVAASAGYAPPMGVAIGGACL